MPARLKIHDPQTVQAALDRRARGDHDPAQTRLLVKHFLAVLETRAPGRSVEVRVPPYAAIQCIEGVRHTRGSPPAVIETDPETWLRLALGELTWQAALTGGTVRASGERTDLSRLLPLR